MSRNRFDPADLLPRFEASLRGLPSVMPGAVVACSGGPDSMTLLDLAHRSKRFPRVYVVHVDHGLRGAASRRDARFVREECARRSVPVRVVRVAVRARSRRTGEGIEASARALRYRVLARAARRWKCPLVLTGHTLNDQAETFFMNLLRGTGPTGLRAIRFRGAWPGPGGAGLQVVRPLLDFSRDEILSYAKSRHIPFRTDSSNRSSVFLRNRIRPLIRRLEKEAPGFLERLGQTARLQSDEEDYWRGERTGWERVFSGLKKVSRGADEGWMDRPRRPVLKLDFRRFLRYHKTVQRRILRQVLGLSDFSNIEGFRHFLTDSIPGNRWVFPNGWRAERSVARVTIFPPADKKRDTRSFRFRRTPSSVATRFLRKRPARWPCRRGLRAVVDADRLVGPLCVRRWEPGDRFRPLGLTGRKKLQDFFVDRKVPAPFRRRVPIVWDSEKIVWIAGHEISEDVKVDRSTRRFLELTLPEGDAEPDAS